MSMKRTYYAEGTDVFADPVITQHDDGTSSCTMGFHVCTVSEWLNPEAAEEIAAALNRESLLVEAMNMAPNPAKYHTARGFDVDLFLADYAVFSSLKRNALKGTADLPKGRAA